MLVRIRYIKFIFRKLGYTASHGIMAGYTDFSVGVVRD